MVEVAVNTFRHGRRWCRKGVSRFRFFFRSPSAFIAFNIVIECSRIGRRTSCDVFLLNVQTIPGSKSPKAPSGALAFATLIDLLKNDHRKSKNMHWKCKELHEGTDSSRTWRGEHLNRVWRCFRAGNQSGCSWLWPA